MSHPKSSVVADGLVVSIHYTLTDDDGDVVDSSEGQEPLAYLHGHSNIVPGLEQALLGKQVGDRLKAVVAPADGYGEFDPAGEERVPRDAFPEDIELEPGMQFTATGPDGAVSPVWIAGLEGDEVLVDMNHPLAGQTLHFDVEVVAIRTATPEELDHGHPHGADGDDDEH